MLKCDRSPCLCERGLCYAEYCDAEDHRGRRCVYGPGHTCDCCFTTLRLSICQELAILALAEAEAAGGDQEVDLTAGPVRALARRGFVEEAEGHLKLTPAGKRVAFYLAEPGTNLREVSR